MKHGGRRMYAHVLLFFSRPYTVLFATLVVAAVTLIATAVHSGPNAPASAFKHDHYQEQHRHRQQQQQRSRRHLREGLRANFRQTPLVFLTPGVSLGAPGGLNTVWVRRTGVVVSVQVKRMPCLAGVWSSEVK